MLRPRHLAHTRLVENELRFPAPAAVGPLCALFCLLVGPAAGALFGLAVWVAVFLLRGVGGALGELMEPHLIFRSLTLLRIDFRLKVLKKEPLRLIKLQPKILNLFLHPRLRRHRIRHRHLTRHQKINLLELLLQAIELLAENLGRILSPMQEFRLYFRRNPAFFGVFLLDLELRFELHFFLDDVAQAQISHDLRLLVREGLFRWFHTHRRPFLLVRFNPFRLLDQLFLLDFELVVKLLLLLVSHAEILRFVVQRVV